MKKETNVSKVKQLMDSDKNISVKEICAKTGLPASRVYVIRNYLKRNKKLTRVNKKPRMKQTEVNTNLKAENDKLHGWCLEWRDKCDKLEGELNRVRHLYMDQLAVVRYLETKIEQLFK